MKTNNSIYQFNYHNLLTMRKIYLLSIAILISLGNLFAQSPQKFNYQAVARDASGNLIANQAVSFRISILQGSASGTVAYSETHNLTTNAYGQATLIIGAGTVVSGTFSSIGWGTNNHYIKTEMDATGGSIYNLMGTSQLLSVPYALYSNTSGSGGGGTTYTAGSGININGSVISNTAPNQTVTLTMGSGLSSTGSYPNFSLSNTQPNATHTGDATGSNYLTVERIQGRPVSVTTPGTGQVLKWDASQQWIPANDNNTNYSPGTGISVVGSTISNTAPDQVVTLTMGGGLSTMGSYPNFTLTNNQPNATHSGDATGSNTLTVERIRGRPVSATTPGIGQILKWDASQEWIPANDNNTNYSPGTGISVVGSTISNTAPDQVVTLTMGGGLSTMGSYPNFSLTNTKPNATHSGDATGDSYLTVERIRGRPVSTTAPGTGQVLKWDASQQWIPANDNNTALPGGSSSQTLRYDGSNWVASGLLTNDGNGLGVGGAPYLNSQLYLNRPSTSFGANYANIYAFRSGTNSAASGGTGWPVAQVDAAIKGYSYYGNNYTAGVAGYSQLDYTSSAAVIGGKHNGTTFGALAYKDENSDTWAGFFNGNINIIGTMRIVGGVPATGKVLTSDDNGNASWQTLSGATAWATSGNNIYNTNSGNVGIGTSAPTKKLEVSGDALINGHTVGRGGGNIVTNLAIGDSALFSNTSGDSNIANGYQALYSNTSGDVNTAVGNGALYSNRANSRSTAIGHGAMFFADDRYVERETFNTALGYEALMGSIDATVNYGRYNTAIGDQALYSNTTGDENTANGYQALYSNTSGDQNTANGYQALFLNEGNFNVASGYKALYSNDGNYNTANGHYALWNNTTGYENTACGSSSLNWNNTGDKNIAYGSYALYNNKANSRSTAIGYGAMAYADNQTAGRETFNTAVGYESLKGSSNPGSNTGQYNTAIGDQSLYSNTSGGQNTANGLAALYYNTTGNKNTASGVGALMQNFANSRSTAIGYYAMGNADNQTNGRETFNTAVGYEALKGSAIAANNIGQWNTAIGDQALYSNTSGTSNAATGVGALYYNTDGYSNTANGNAALYYNTSGYNNTAIGSNALAIHQTGNNNTAIVKYALINITNGSNNTAVGSEAASLLSNVSFGTFVGKDAGASYNNLSNVSSFGYDAYVSASNQVRLGNSSVTSIGGYANWTNVSDARFKTNIKENIAGLDFIMKLRPVSYNFDMDAIASITGTPDSLRLPESDALKAAEVQTGFIAQEVEQAAKETGFAFHGVDVPKNDKDFYGLRYAEFVVPMVKAMQEQQKIIEKQQETINLLLKKMEELENNK